MAFFKFRKAGDEPLAPPAQPESVEVLRQRALHRLLGAAVLVLAGVVGFPLLFDRQPRPIPVDTPIEIPDRNKVAPLSIPAPAARPEAAPELPAASTEPGAPKPGASAAAAVLDLKEEVLLSRAKPASDVTKSIAIMELPAPVRAVSAPSAQETAKSAAQPLDKGQIKTESAPDADAGRFIVQVGAFADVTRAREVRLKVEAAGLKTYTQVVETKEGRRIRVRVGPFADRPEADKAAEKIRRLALPAAILTL